MGNLTHLLEHFSAAAERAGDLSNPKAQKIAARQVQAHYKKLCATEEGKAGIISLMFDSRPMVRLCAAARSLQWTHEKAERVLEDLCKENVFPYSFDAKMTLEEYRIGRLSFDY